MPQRHDRRNRMTSVSGRAYVAPLAYPTLGSTGAELPLQRWLALTFGTRPAVSPRLIDAFSTHGPGKQQQLARAADPPGWASLTLTVRGLAFVAGNAVSESLAQGAGLKVKASSAGRAA